SESAAREAFVRGHCDPTCEILKTHERLPYDRTYLFHTNVDAIKDILEEQYGVWWSVPGGSTVLLRAIPLLRTLGYAKFHIYGADSCLESAGLNEYVHHAY